MITNHANTHTNPPPSPLGEPESKKIGFVAPMLIFPSAKISKTINMLCKRGTTNIPLPPSRLKFDTKLRKVFPNNLAP